jgi:hypothetical protein
MTYLRNIETKIKKESLAGDDKSAGVFVALSNFVEPVFS